MRTRRDFTTILLVIGLAALLLPACAGKSAPRGLDDFTITARVKTALLNDPEIAAPRIDVETVKGVVTLSGRVASKQEEQKAVQVARSIGGVVEVKSALQIQQ